jgi:hypothetical protein
MIRYVINHSDSILPSELVVCVRLRRLKGHLANYVRVAGV